MLIAALGVSHRSTPVEVREKVALPPCQGRAFASSLVESGVASEAVIISTCNRTEIYAVVEDSSARERILFRLAEERAMDPDLLSGYAYWYTDAEAVAHLYRVASSLDSMVLGEAQILGQVREAYRAATEERSTGPILDRLFHTSMRVGKRVRSETGIGDSSLSIPRVASRLAGEVFGDLTGRNALVVGAGEMAALVVESLRDAGISGVRITNRTHHRAETLAETVGGEAAEIGSLVDELRRADIVISSTGAEDWVILNEDVAEALDMRNAEGRPDPLFFIDIAVPRDVDPTVQTLDRAYLYDVDDLQAVVERNADDRREAAEGAEEIITPSVEAYMAWLSTLHVVPLIRELHDEAERIRTHELSRVLGRMDLTDEEIQTIEKMSRTLVNKLLHGPISEIKARAEAGEPFEDRDARSRLHALEGLGARLAHPDRKRR